MSKSKASTIIKKATQILIDNNWIQNNLCLDKDGNRVFPNSKRAYGFDIMGALWAASDTVAFPSEAGKIIGGICAKQDSYHSWSSYYIVSFNDDLKTTKEKVIGLLTAAFVLALQEEGADVETAIYR